MPDRSERSISSPRPGRRAADPTAGDVKFIDLRAEPLMSVPRRLWEHHRELPVGSVARIVLASLDAQWAHDVVLGGGFTAERDPAAVRGSDALTVTAVRARTLADTVGDGLRLLVCGLNPSLYAADAGVGFARPGNRFWPAMLAAGWVTVDRDPRRALDEHRVGMTDLVKRATVRADELTTDEYRAGMARLERLATWLTPQVVCFVGLDGYRRVRDRRAVPGWQPVATGGCSTYVLPNPSGLNARYQHPDFVHHLREAAADRRNGEL